MGKATVIIQGTGNFKGKKKVSFDIGPAAPKVKSISSKKRAVTVTWAPVSGVSGYEIQYTTDKEFTTGVKKTNISGEQKITWKSSKLKKGNKYYVRVRTYTKIKGKKVYGGYSSIKSIKIK